MFFQVIGEGNFIDKLVHNCQRKTPIYRNVVSDCAKLIASRADKLVGEISKKSQ